MICIAIISTDFSSELTSTLSLKLKKESMTDVEDLLETDTRILFPDILNYELDNQKALLKRMTDKATEEGSDVITLKQLFDDRAWFGPFTEGKLALVLFEVPFKSLLISLTHDSEPNSSFVCLKQWSQNSMISVVFNRNLDKQFRETLNFG